MTFTKWWASYSKSIQNHCKVWAYMHELCVMSSTSLQFWTYCFLLSFRVFVAVSWIQLVAWVLIEISECRPTSRDTFWQRTLTEQNKRTIHDVFPLSEPPEHDLLISSEINLCLFKHRRESITTLPEGFNKAQFISIDFFRSPAWWIAPEAFFPRYCDIF